MREINLGDLDFETLHNCALERTDVFKDQKQRLKFILPEVSKELNFSQQRQLGGLQTTSHYSTIISLTK